MEPDQQVAAPMAAPIIRVKQDWIDQNGHMNMAFYVLAFDLAIDHIWGKIGLGPEYLRRANASTFALQSQVHYLREVLLDDPLRIEFQLLDYDQKRIHCFMAMYHDDEDYLAATEERVTVHVDMEIRKSSPFPDNISENLTRIFDYHKALPKDARVGSSLSLKR